MPSPKEVPAILVSYLLSEDATHLKLKCVAGEEGLKKEISIPRAQSPGLAFSGHMKSVQEGRVQVLGKSEVVFLSHLGKEKRRSLMRRLCREPIPCFVITTALKPPAELTSEAKKTCIPVLSTSLASSSFTDLLNTFLEQKLAPRTTVHGVLLDVFGLGVLLVGDSGIGKSECALDLITRGHRLIADDLVEIRKVPEDVLIGTSMDLGRHYIEVRGLGLINIKDLFGVSAIRHSKRIELVVAMERWKKGELYDRLGLDFETYDILSVQIPKVRLPVAPGRSLSTLIEVASRSHLLKLRGPDAAKIFAERLEYAMAKSLETGQGANEEKNEQNRREKVR
jgi:HPr kinase/phosphorylase